MSEDTTPATIAAQRAAGWPEWHPEDYCHRCGGTNPPWVTDAHLWTVGAGLYDILCITCWVDAYQAATGETVCLRVVPLEYGDEVEALRRSEGELRQRLGEVEAERDALAAGGPADVARVLADQRTIIAGLRRESSEYRQIAGDALAAIQRVRDLHGPNGAGTIYEGKNCRTCLDGYGEPVRLPCPTLDAIKAVDGETS